MEKFKITTNGLKFIKYSLIGDIAVKLILMVYMLNFWESNVPFYKCGTYQLATFIVSVFFVLPSILGILLLNTACDYFFNMQEQSNMQNDILQELKKINSSITTVKFDNELIKE